MLQDITINRNPRKQTFEWGHLTWYAEGQAGNSDYLTTGCCVLKPGWGNPVHRHPNCEEVLTVLSGAIHHTGPGEERVRLEAGSTVTIPAGVWHRAVNVGAEEAVLAISFSSSARETEGEVK